MRTKTSIEGRSLRIKRRFVAALLVLTPTLAGCTPGELEQSMNMVVGSFEQGGLEGGLSSMIFITEMAVPVIGMRLSILSALGGF